MTDFETVGPAVTLDLTDAEAVTLDAPAPAEAVTLDAPSAAPVVLDLAATGVTLDLTEPAPAVALDLVAESVVLEVLGAPSVALDLGDPSVTLDAGSAPAVVLDLGLGTGPPGPPGPPGLPGPPGSDYAYRFSQSAPAALWIVVHGLGYRPAVTTTDTAGSVIVGDVTIVTEDVVEIRFGRPLAGYVNLS